MRGFRTEYFSGFLVCEPSWNGRSTYFLTQNSLSELARG